MLVDIECINYGLYNSLKRIYNIGKEVKLRKILAKRYPESRFIGNAYADDGCQLGSNTVFHCGVSLSNTVIGRFTYVAFGTSISHATIGSFCSIGPEVRIGLARHPTRDFVSTYPAFFSENNDGCQESFVNKQLFQEIVPIEIGNDVWVGARVMISGGIKIGDGAIVAGGAFVTKDVLPYSIVAGVPARHIRFRFTPAEIEELMKIKWWENDVEWIKAHAPHFDDVQRFIEIYSMPHIGEM